MNQKPSLKCRVLTLLAVACCLPLLVQTGSASDSSQYINLPLHVPLTVRALKVLEADVLEVEYQGQPIGFRFLAVAGAQTADVAKVVAHQQQLRVIIRKVEQDGTPFGDVWLVPSGIHLRKVVMDTSQRVKDLAAARKAEQDKNIRAKHETPFFESPTKRVEPPRYTPEPGPVSTPFVTHANSPEKYVTMTAGTICLSPWWYTEHIQSALRDDTHAQAHLFETKKCLHPKAGLPVSILTPGLIINTKTIHVRVYLPETTTTLEGWTTLLDLQAIRE